MHLNSAQIEQMHRVRRLNLINGISGIKPANLIGTRSVKHGPNLSIFSSIVHLGSDPALLGFVLRPAGEVPRNTYDNIKELGYFTINHIHESFAENAHYTSAKFDHGVSEFEKCGLTDEYLSGFPAPFVKESKIKIGLKFEDEIQIKANNTLLIVGSIVDIIIPEECIDDKGYVRLDKAGDVGIGGLNSYYSIKRVRTFPYVRLTDFPTENLSKPNS